MPFDAIHFSLAISVFVLGSTVSVIGYLIYAVCIRCTNHSSADHSSLVYEDDVTAEHISLKELNRI